MHKKKCRGLILFIISTIIVTVLSMMGNNDVRKGVEESADVFLKGQYILLIFLCVFIYAVNYLVLFGYDSKAVLAKKIHIGIEHAWIVSVISLGIVYMMVLSPVCAPDEISHYISAYKLSSTLMGRESLVQDGHVIIRGEDYYIEDLYGEPVKPEDWEAYAYGTEHVGTGEDRVQLGRPLEESTYRIIHNWDSLYGSKSGKDIPEEAVSTITWNHTSPLVYLPQAIGITIARLLGCDSITLLYLGRIMNLLFYAIMMMLAIRIIPMGKKIVYGVGLLPMSLQLAISMSYDVEVISLSILFISVVLYLAYKAEHVRWFHIVSLCVIMVVLGPCKMVYSALVLLMFLIPVKKYHNKIMYAVSVLAVIVSTCTALYLVQQVNLQAYAQVTDGVVAYSGQSGYTLQELIHRRMDTLDMFYKTLVYQGEYLHLTTIGAYLAAVDTVISVPYIVICILTGCLIVLGLRKPGASIRVGVKSWIWIAIIEWIIIAGVFVAMMISWTSRDALCIEGIQGRYFLPILPLSILLINNNYLVMTKDIDREVLLIMIACDLYAILRIFTVVCIRING